LHGLLPQPQATPDAIEAGKLAGLVVLSEYYFDLPAHRMTMT